MIDVSKVIAYESGDMDEGDTLEFFSELVRSGAAWTLQGSYGRMAKALINGGFLDTDGTILATIERTDDEW